MRPHIFALAPMYKQAECRKALHTGMLATQAISTSDNIGTRLAAS